MKTKRSHTSGTFVAIVFSVLSVGFALSGMAQTRGGASPAATGTRAESGGADLTGIYVLVPNNVTLPGGLKSEGGPEQIPLQPSAVAVQRTRTPQDDLAKLCLPVGPFRMMAWEGNKMDVYLSPGRITMLYENYFLGHMRTVYLDRQHTRGPTLWVGDSIGHWDGDTLVVDTNNFNEYTWLNGAGAPHSDALHLTERYRLVGGRKYLEVKMTAEDPKVLTAPYTYTRYYERGNSEIQEDICQDDLATVGE